MRDWWRHEERLVKGGETVTGRRDCYREGETQVQACRGLDNISVRHTSTRLLQLILESPGLFFKLRADTLYIPPSKVVTWFSADDTEDKMLF